MFKKKKKKTLVANDKNDKIWLSSQLEFSYKYSNTEVIVLCPRYLLWLV